MDREGGREIEKRREREREKERENNHTLSMTSNLFFHHSLSFSLSLFLSRSWPSSLVRVCLLRASVNRLRLIFCNASVQGAEKRLSVKKVSISRQTHRLSLRT